MRYCEVVCTKCARRYEMIACVKEERPLCSNCFAEFKGLVARVAIANADDRETLEQLIGEIKAWRQAVKGHDRKAAEMWRLAEDECQKKLNEYLSVKTLH